MKLLNGVQPCTMLQLWQMWQQIPYIPKLLQLLPHLPRYSALLRLRMLPSRVRMRVKTIPLPAMKSQF